MNEEPHPERPLGVALVAGWFAVGAIGVGAMVVNFRRAMEIVATPFGKRLILILMAGSTLVAIALAAIACGVWRGSPKVRPAAGIVLAATAAVAFARATTPWHYLVAAVNIAAIVYLSYRARSM